jgi:BNR/Asp-box repeat protein
MRKPPIARVSIVLAASLAIVMIATGLSQATSVTVTKVSPGTMGTTPFPKNKQNESPMAVDPIDPMIAATGANDEIIEPNCTPATGGSSSCPFVPGVSTDGVYVTTNGGGTWSQHILDWSSFGLVSDGDPQVSFGPKPDGNGGWTFASGARLYAASLATRIGQHCLSCELDAVAYSDDNGATWSTPKVVTNKQNPVHFNDKEAVWADATPSSPHFGTVYVSWTLFTGNPASNFGKSSTFSPEPIVVSHSTDGGAHWSPPVRLTRAANNGAVGGRQGSTMRTGPDGTLYVIWDGSMNHQSAVVGARSTDGGLTFSKPFLVSFKNDNPTLPGSSFRNDSFPAADIDANGNLYVTWTDYTNGHGVVKFAKSTNGGRSWNTSTAADVSGRSPFYPGIAVNGSNVFIGFTALDDVAAGTDPGAGVVAYDAYYVLSSNGGSSFGAPVLVPGTNSDPDASSTNSLGAQFLGDYNAAAAGSDGAFWFSFTGTMQGATCDAIDMWRAGLASKPNIYDSCPTDFGNSDIFVVKVGP